jgi:hypothetical protein
MFKTEDVEAQCEFAYPDGKMKTNRWTYSDSCRLSFKTDQCEFTLVTMSTKEWKITIHGKKMTREEAEKYIKGEGVLPKGLSVRFKDTRTIVDFQSKQGKVSFDIKPWTFYVNTNSISDCTGMCGTCSGKQPKITDAKAFAAKHTCTKSGGIAAIGNGKKCQIATPAPTPAPTPKPTPAP